MKIALLVVMALGFGSIVTPARAYEFAASAQAMFIAAGNTDRTAVSTSVEVSGFFQGVVFWPITGSVSAFAYGGPEFHIGDVSVLTGALMTPDAGVSMIASNWVTVNNCFTHGLEFFVVFDAYFNVEGHDGTRFYGDVEFIKEMSERWSIGVANEYFATTHELHSIALGPFIRVDKFRALLAYEWTPVYEAPDAFLVRLIYRLYFNALMRCRIVL